MVQSRALRGPVLCFTLSLALVLCFTFFFLPAAYKRAVVPKHFEFDKSRATSRILESINFIVQSYVLLSISNRKICFVS